jgi:eukaryotic-like serine/threonine-protein kinase
MSAAFILLRCVGKAIIKNGVKNVLNLVSFGIGGDVLMDIWEEWKRLSADEEQRLTNVEEVAKAPPDKIAVAATEIVKEAGTGLSDADKLVLTSYLEAVPPQIRASQSRPADLEGKTVRPGATFRKAEDLLPLLPPRAPRFKPGDRPLPGVDWELVKLLGTGGFGEVWKARNPHFDGVRPVAIKFCLDPAARDRLLKHEAGILNRVMHQGRHDGIVPLLHTYLSADPRCLEYEFVEGGDLAGLIQERKGAFTPRQAAQVVHRLAEIVGFAHRLSPPIVHRDLKPANILVEPRPGGKLNGRARISCKAATGGIGV